MSTKVEREHISMTFSTSMAKEQHAFVAENGEQKHPFKFDFNSNTY
jgi:hypothetical protein